MAETKIEWADFTFNPWRGCTKVAAGCANCYAETLSGRNPGTLGVWGPHGKRVVAAESYWKLPEKWDRQAAKNGVRRKVFCGSLMDIFEDWTGPMVDVHGEELYDDFDGGFTEAQFGYGDIPLPGQSRITMQGVRNRVFSLIDRTPNLTWLLLTKRPENVERMMPECHWHYVAMMDGGPEPFRPNVWLGSAGRLLDGREWSEVPQPR